MPDSQRPHGLQPARLLSPWDFPGKSTGVGCHCPLRIPLTTQKRRSRGSRLPWKLKKEGKRYIPHVEFHKQPIPPGQWSIQKQNKIHAVNYNSEGSHAKKSKTITVLAKTGLKPATGLSEPLVRSFFLPLQSRPLNWSPTGAQQNESPRSIASPHQFRPPPAD